MESFWVFFRYGSEKFYVSRFTSEEKAEKAAGENNEAAKKAGMSNLFYEVEQG